MEKPENYQIYMLETTTVGQPGAPTEKLKIWPTTTAKPVNSKTLMETYEGLLKSIKAMCEKAQNLVEGYRIDSITFKVVVDAEGKIAFVAKAGIQADI